MRGLAFRLLRDQFQADEVAQEVMVGVWQRAGTFNRALGAGRAWILRMARGRSIDWSRSNQRARDRDQAYFQDHSHSAAGHEVPVFAWARQDVRTVQSALLELSVPQREAVSLAFFTSETYPQIAVRLRIPLGILKHASAGL